MSDFYSTRLINYYPEGLIPGGTPGTSDDLPSQTPLSILTNAPSAFNEQSIPRISLYSIFKLLPGWTVTGEYTYNRTGKHYQFYSNRFRLAGVQLAAEYSAEKGQDFYRTYNAITKYNALNIFTNYDHSWGAYSFKVVAGFNQERSFYRYFYGDIPAQAVPTVPSFVGGTDEKTTDDKYSEHSIYSDFARLNYTLVDRHLLKLNGRYGGSSKLPKNRRFGFFPSVSVGWHLD